MTKLKNVSFAAAAAFVFTAGIAPTVNSAANDANAVNTTAKPATAPPTREALVALEKSAFEAWKTRDAKFWNTFLADKFVGYGSSGKLDKASAIKELAGTDCTIKSYALSGEQMTPLGKDAALLTFKAAVDGTCDGQKVPAISSAASVYVRDGRDGAKWKAAFHAEAPVVDPKAAAAKPAEADKKREAPEKDKAKTAAANTAPAALVAAERAIWEAWRAHDARKLADLTTSEISFINIFGTFFATKADALKDWTSEGCDVKSVSVTNAAATMLSPTVGILTFNGGADGTCFGQKVGPIWGTSIYVKDKDGEGNPWKWTFGINLPAG